MPVGLVLTEERRDFPRGGFTGLSREQPRLRFIQDDYRLLPYFEIAPAPVGAESPAAILAV